MKPVWILLKNCSPETLINPTLFVLMHFRMIYGGKRSAHVCVFEILVRASQSRFFPHFTWSIPEIVTQYMDQ